MSENSSRIIEHNPVYQVYDAVDGLVSHTTCLLQNDSGCIWVGTWTGLYRFDGDDFSLVYAKKDTTDNYITCLYMDKKDRLWFGSGGPHGSGNGVVCYDGEMFFTSTTEDGLASNYILDIEEDSLGRIWFGTNQGVTCFDGERFTAYRADEGLTDQDIQLVHRDRHDRLWFAGWNDVFYINDNNDDDETDTSFTRWGDTSKWTGFDYKDSRGGIWLLHHSGVDYLHQGRRTTLTEEDGLYWNRQFLRNRIVEDVQGNIWILAHETGICRYDGSTFYAYMVNGSQVGMGRDILPDAEGNIWTNDFSLLRLAPYTADLIEDDTVARSLMLDSQRRLWYINADFNMYCLSITDGTDTRKSDNIARGVDYSAPLCMLESSSGRVWLGGGNFQPYKLTRYTSIDALYENGIIYSSEISDTDQVADFSDNIPFEYYNIYTMLESRDGNIWMGACISPWSDQGAIIMYNGTDFKVILMPQTHITSLYEDQQGRIWAGGYKGGGISCIDGGTLTTYTSDQGLIDDVVRGIIEDEHNRLWVLSLQTIYRFEDKQFNSVSEEQNLPPYMYQCMAKDDQGRLWFGTSTGGIIFTDGRHIQQLTADDGLPTNGINGIIPQTDGKILVLSGKGITLYNPQLPGTPAIEIKQVIADKAYERCDHLTLTTAETDLFTITYKGHGLATRRMRYSYILEGYDDTWRHTWSREVRYENLPAGEYTFKVIAISRDLTPSETPATMRLSVQPDPQVVRIVELETDKKRLQAENIYLQEEIRLNHNFEAIISRSQVLRRVLHRVEQVAVTDSTVLILGETGTGKELLARAVHSTSNRADRPLVKVDCATLPENLIESELFGHEKGAFTGAMSRKIGRFELADQGTLFLDEIGELPPSLQSKLLRILQDGAFERLGGNRTCQVDVRIIAATSRDLEMAMNAGTFREDLYYRLHVFPLEIPPLRSRKDDIPVLVQHFVKKHGNRIGKVITQASQEVMDRLMDYDWPGNVRELEHVIERGLIMSSGAWLEAGDWIPGQDFGQSRPDLLTMANMERNHILETLETAGWRIRGSGGAAAMLDMKPTTLESRMAKLGIKRPSP